MNAEILYTHYSSTTFSSSQTRDLCKLIEQADGDRAKIIVKAKIEGWWYQSDSDTCKAIRQAPGNRALAIYFARKHNFWDQSDEETSKEILKSPGTVDIAVYKAKKDKWWVEPKIFQPIRRDALELYNTYDKGMSLGPIMKLCESIRHATGNRAWVIFKAFSERWWDQDVYLTCEAIRQAPGNRALAICRAKNAGWWDQSDEETTKEILKSPGDVKTAMLLAQEHGWWSDLSQISLFGKVKLQIL